MERQHLVFVTIYLLVFGAASLGCMNECSFFERCNGDVAEYCGGGPDHVVGRKVRSVPCEGKNPVCHEQEDRVACVAQGPVACNRETFEPACDGDTHVTTCILGHVAYSECAERYDPAARDVRPTSCQIVDGQATCALMQMSAGRDTPTPTEDM